MVGEHLDGSISANRPPGDKAKTKEEAGNSNNQEELAKTIEQPAHNPKSIAGAAVVQANDKII